MQLVVVASGLRFSIRVSGLGLLHYHDVQNPTFYMYMLKVHDFVYILIHEHNPTTQDLTARKLAWSLLEPHLKGQ